jgi:hypothetical protein
MPVRFSLVDPQTGEVVVWSNDPDDIPPDADEQRYVLLASERITRLAQRAVMFEREVSSIARDRTMRAGLVEPHEAVCTLRHVLRVDGSTGIIDFAGEETDRQGTVRPLTHIPEPGAPALDG